MSISYIESSRPGLEGEEEFVDILEERRRSSDLSHALRTFNPLPHRGLPCSTKDLNTAVLESQYLRYVTKEIATETGLSVEEVKEDACVILKEMSHNLQLGAIRLMAFTFSKVFKRLFTNIYVNMEGLNRLQQAIQEGPVVLMPNHRSYVDFLIISYILFTYDLPIPVIAAGVPLAGMKMVGEILRRSGAFYIRRAIGSDRLYWAVLSEYVKTLVRQNIIYFVQREFAPVEFYVEGLRSRTLKSLTPKLGMMHMVLEPFFKGEVYDITLVPISISYERVLEETLLAQELLGVPKPKETTTGLLKATRVLQEDYGCMHVNIGQPLSVRQLSKDRINRRQYNLIPRDLPQKPSAETQACVSWLAHRVVLAQEQGSILSPWSLMACVLLQSPSDALIEQGLPLEQLSQRTLWLRRLALGFGASLGWPGHLPESDVMSRTLQLHRSLVRSKGGRVYLVVEAEPAGSRPVGPEVGVVSRAAAVLMVASYRNQALHVFARQAMLATAMHTTNTTQRDELFAFFNFLQAVFSSEFIFMPGCSAEDFEEACYLLKKSGAVQTTQHEVTEIEAGLHITSFLRTLLQPFIESYQMVFRYLCEEGVQVVSQKQFVVDVQGLATRRILSGELHTYEALSSDTLKNVLPALQRLEAITKFREAQHDEYRINKAAIKRIGDILSGLISPQMLMTAPEARL